jgi:hypothetical protein
MENKEIFVCVNAYSAKSSLPGIIDLYKQEFDNFLLPFTIPYIQSLKKPTDNVDYPLKGTSGNYVFAVYFYHVLLCRLMKY